MQWPWRSLGRSNSSHPPAHDSSFFPFRGPGLRVTCHCAEGRSAQAPERVTALECGALWGTRRVRVRTEARKTRPDGPRGVGTASHAACGLPAGCGPVAPALGSRQVRSGIGWATSGLYLLVCKMGTMPQPDLRNSTVPIWITKKWWLPKWKQFSIPILFKAMKYIYTLQ